MSATLGLSIGVTAVLTFTGAAPTGAAQSGAQMNMAPLAKSGTLDDDVRVAERGDATSQFKLGFRYYSGFFGIPQDHAQAIQWFRRAADQGLAIAQATLGGLYADGEVVPRDYERAAIWYRKAAEQGFTGAQFDLGALYANGQGVPQDDEQAVKWYRKAAERGHADAQLNLALMYEQGRGVSRDGTAAAKWLRQAADHGNATAQFHLGMRYQTGNGVPLNRVEAQKWMILAESRASGEDQKQYADARAALSREMRVTQVKEAQRRARRWMEAFNKPR